MRFRIGGIQAQRLLIGLLGVLEAALAPVRDPEVQLNAAVLGNDERRPLEERGRVGPAAVIHVVAGQVQQRGQLIRVELQGLLEVLNSVAGAAKAVVDLPEHGAQP